MQIKCVLYQSETLTHFLRSSFARPATLLTQLPKVPETENRFATSFKL